MTALVFLKLLALFAVVALGWLAGRQRWLGPPGADPARVLSSAAFYIFIPALLFRTTARLDLPSLPWGTLAAFFAPVLLMLAAVYLAQRGRPGAVAAPCVRAIAACFGNTVQLGVPLVAAVFGEAGLAILVAIISLHALTLLSVLTALVELDLARARSREAGARASLGATLRATVRNTVIHPVVLPVLAGLAWNVLGLPLPVLVDELLQMLGQAVVPLCLVLIGLSLAYYGLKQAARGAVALSLLKLLVLPALVLGVGRLLGLQGLALSVVVMAAALPVGANALIFAQRYATLEAEVTAAAVLSTLGFVFTAPLWLALLQRLS